MLCAEKSLCGAEHGVDTAPDKIEAANALVSATLSMNLLDLQQAEGIFLEERF